MCVIDSTEGATWYNSFVILTQLSDALMTYLYTVMYTATQKDQDTQLYSVFVSKIGFFRKSFLGGPIVR